MDRLICLYLDRYRTKCRGNFRFGPLSSEGFRFTHLGSWVSAVLFLTHRKLGAAYAALIKFGVAFEKWLIICTNQDKR